MKVVKEDISKSLARAEITESTQWLSAKKRKVLLFSVKSALLKDLLRWVYSRYSGELIRNTKINSISASNCLFLKL